jgi:uncharacterized protein (DUF2384 family)
MDLYYGEIYRRLAMERVVQERPAAEVRAVALKAYGRVAENWSLTGREAATLADMSESTWKRAKKPGYTGELTRDQMLRLSAVIGIFKALELYFDPSLARQWVKLPNKGPEFDGVRPVDAMIAGGLPKILRVRGYLDALRGGM